RELDQPDAAFVTLQAAFRENYADDTTSRELERLASATNRWTELLTEYTEVVQAITEPRSAAELWVKIGRWYGIELGHLEYAIASEGQALKLVPDFPPALAALAEFHRKGHQWPELVDVLERRARAEDDPDKKVETLLELAEV